MPDILLKEIKQENLELRVMLAFSYSGSELYADDGELQDSKCHPFIDFKRDSVITIREKMMARLSRELVAQNEAHNEAKGVADVKNA